MAATGFETPTGFDICADRCPYDVKLCGSSLCTLPPLLKQDLTKCPVIPLLFPLTQSKIIILLLQV